MEHTATCASKNRVSRFAVLIADFCNKIGTYATCLAEARRSAFEGKPEAFVQFFETPRVFEANIGPTQIVTNHRPVC